MLSSVVTPLTLIALVAAGNVVSLTCKDDKFLSCLLASPSAAVPYCRYFAHVTVTTPTVYVTSTPTILAATSTTTTSTTTTVTTTTSVPVPGKRASELDEWWPGQVTVLGCLAWKKTSPHAVSSACSCFSSSYTPPAATATTEGPPTTVFTTTDTIFSTTTTTSVSTTADACGGIGYNGGGNGMGNIVQAPIATDARDCCEQCQVQTNCVASAYVGGVLCEHLIKVEPLSGAPTSPLCPLGIEAYDGLTGPGGAIFLGPCGVPG